MAYIALYRKYRPTTFDSVVGQENVTRVLKNQIKTGKISHAYLFSGTRGTGKTSAAKVFARAINCLNPKDGEPCNECKVCKDILESNTTDVIEMDAASNNSVENIRQIRQEVAYATIDVKYRVYIIDEVHMLTTSAFNALLKTLEEPPQNVVFILATTEQHKIPVTILSRCLRFDFNRISENDLVNRLKFVLESENIQFEDKAVEYIAKLADGALRDGLSILDRCILEENSKLKYEDVLKIVGATDKDVIEHTVNSILKYDIAESLKDVDNIVVSGKDIRQYINQLTESFLQVLLESDGSKEKYRIINIIDILSKLDSQIRFTTNPVIVLKAAIVDICTPYSKINDGELSIDPAIINKISSMELKISKLEEVISSYTNTNNFAPSGDITSKQLKNEYVDKTLNKSVEKKEVNNPKGKISNTSALNVDSLKRYILESGKLKLYSALAGAIIRDIDDDIRIVTPNSFAYNILKTQESINSIKEALLNNYGIDKQVVVDLEQESKTNKKKIEELLSNEDINYTSMD